ncbi:MAG TPA: hypothetical protein VFZ22_15620, partial [Pyrinomonadaceae bacterium]|nr:hypothetical protein [Pyrinomonadaceae bacterium]
ARFLVKKGITSISLNPDTVIQTTQTILEAESETPSTDRKVLTIIPDVRQPSDVESPSVMLLATETKLRGPGS